VLVSGVRQPTVVSAEVSLKARLSSGHPALDRVVDALRKKQGRKVKPNEGRPHSNREDYRGSHPQGYVSIRLAERQSDRLTIAYAARIPALRSLSIIGELHAGGP
jgi:hypothetical protein